MSIQVKNLSKVYGKQKAIDDLSFHIDKKEIVGFLGPNGAGKTTTMKILTCFIPPSSGQAYVNQLNVEDHAIEVRKRTGYLPEHNPLYLDMYVKEYLEFVGSIYQLPKIKNRVKEMIELTGLTVEQNKKIGQLSKGYRQRVGLAQAIIHNPDVLILDEPTSGLDPNQIVEIRNIIKEIGKEKTVMLSTHIMQEVEAMCNRVIIINKGKIVADGKTEELKNQFNNQKQLAIKFNQSLTTNQIKEIEKFAEISNNDNPEFVFLSNDAEALKQNLFQYAVSNQLQLSEMKTIENSLEDIFKNVTK